MAICACAARSAQTQPVIRRIPATDTEQTCPYHVGNVYQRKLPGLNGRPSFRVQKPAPVRQRLADVTRADVIAEGRHGSSARALYRWQIDWVKDNDRAWHKRHLTASDALILERWRKRWAGTDCWVLTIALQDPVRCMAEQRDILSGKTMRGLTSNLSDQYVSSGGIDPYAEGVDEATLTRIVAGELERRALAEAQRRLRQDEWTYSRIGTARRSA